MYLNGQDINDPICILMLFKNGKYLRMLKNNGFAPLVNNSMDDNKPIVINGRAGCGKSTLIKKIQESITQQRIKYMTLATTNKAARLVDGMTMHKFMDFKEMDFQTLICDEMSMTPEVVFKFCRTLKRVRPDLQFIVAGDYNQLLPVCDRADIFDYENSAPLYELVNGNGLTLTTRRRSDPTTYNMC